MLLRLNRLLHANLEIKKATLLAYYLLWRVRLGLYWQARQTLKRYKQPGVNRFKRCTVEELSYLIYALSSLVPQATCLTQALAAKALMAHYGHEVKLQIGVMKDEANDTEIKAHAWLTHNGKVVLGQVSNLADYSILTGGSV